MRQFFIDATVVLAGLALVVLFIALAIENLVTVPSFVYTLFMSLIYASATALSLFIVTYPFGRKPVPYNSTGQPHGGRRRAYKGSR